MRENNLTDVNYWRERQKHSHSIRKPFDNTPEWLDVIIPYLKEYENMSFIELGCSPGYVSSLICSRVRFVPYGIDFSAQSYLYLENMKRIGYEAATLFVCDIKDFNCESEFDVVLSAGLVEHFIDPDQIMFHHYRLARHGGLIIMIIPNFRYIQWLYHFLFDRQDLSVHNIKMMNLETFKVFSKIKEIEILYLGYVGHLLFWNVGKNGPITIVIIRRTISRIIREATNKILGKILPPNSKYYAPWIVFVGKKNT